MAALPETAQAQEPTECGRKVEIQVQNPILGADKGSGNPQIEPAEQFIFPLGEASQEACDRIEMPGTFAEAKADA